MPANEIKKVEKNYLYPYKQYTPTKPFINFLPRLNLSGNIQEADFALIPHPWQFIKDNIKYLEYLRELSKLIPLLVFNTGDISPKVELPNTLELRTFLHPWENSYRKVVLPWPIEGLEFKLRSYRQTPKVSFMGYVPKLSPGSLLGKSVNTIYHPIKSSVYINRRITELKITSMTSKFDTTFVKRKSFSALNSNPNYLLHSNEYKTLIASSDYILCPRGFGNATVRFYEALSSGATPVLIDSGNQLPHIQNNNFWSTNILNVTLFSNWSLTIKNDWQKMGVNDAYQKRQESNVEVFQKELNFEIYLEKLFENYLVDI